MDTTLLAQTTLRTLYQTFISSLETELRQILRLNSLARFSLIARKYKLFEEARWICQNWIFENNLDK